MNMEKLISDLELAINVAETKGDVLDLRRVFTRMSYLLSIMVKV